MDNKDLSFAIELGKVLVSSGLFPDIRNVNQAVMRILLGQEFGFSPITSMIGIKVVDGEVIMGVGLMATLLKRSGKYEYKIKNLSDTECDIEFYEIASSDSLKLLGTSTFTIKDAGRAGLDSEYWTKYPRNMLFARAMSNGVRWFCPDLTGATMYVKEEFAPALMSPEDKPFASPQAAWQWGASTMGVSFDEAKAAYLMVKDKEKPKDASQMATLWRAYVRKRLERLEQGWGDEEDKEDEQEWESEQEEE